MKLSGKCKDDFEKWYKNLSYHYPSLEMKIQPPTVGFINLPPSMQWGVIQDFADSVGYEVGTVNMNGWIASVKAPPKSFITWSKIRTNTRQEARIAAVEKFNELYNSK